MNNAAPVRPRIVVEIDDDVWNALDQACRHDRLSKPAFARIALVRALRDARYLPTNEGAPANAY